MTHESAHVTERMQNLVDQWKDAGDGRAVFLHCYLLMTQNMLSAIDDRQFNDSVWTHLLLRHFADYYFAALESYEQRGRVPRVWQVAYDAARRPDTHVVQNLMLGVNAHINYDLVLTLVDILAPEWEALSEEGRAQRYADHCTVNAVIGRTIDSVQDGVLEPLSPSLEVVDWLLGPFDEWLTSRLIAHWRDKVWQDAVTLLEMTVPAARAQQHQQIEIRTLQRANAILHSRPRSLTQLL